MDMVHKAKKGRQDPNWDLDGESAHKAWEKAAAFHRPSREECERQRDEMRRNQPPPKMALYIVERSLYDKVGKVFRWNTAPSDILKQSFYFFCLGFIRNGEKGVCFILRQYFPFF